MHFCDDLIGICLASLECKLHEAETESSFISASLTSNTAGPGWMPINIHGRQGSSRRGEKEGGKERELFAKTAPVILPPSALHFAPPPARAGSVSQLLESRLALCPLE